MGTTTESANHGTFVEGYPTGDGAGLADLWKQVYFSDGPDTTEPGLTWDESINNLYLRFTDEDADDKISQKRIDSVFYSSGVGNKAVTVTPVSAAVLNGQNGAPRYTFLDIDGNGDLTPTDISHHFPLLAEITVSGG